MCINASILLVAISSAMPFAARFGGRDIAVHEARVSAVPFNQVWAGFQRPKSQTKIAHFVSFDVAAPGDLELTLPECAPEDVRIFPLSRRNRLVRDGRRMAVFVDGPEQFVVDLAGETLHVFANPPFRHKHVAGELYFGPGVHDVGAIVPESGQTVCIDEGAVVYGGIFVGRKSNVRVVGRGIVDSSRLRRLDGGGDEAVDGDMRLSKVLTRFGLGRGECGDVLAQTCFCAYASTNVTVEGVVFRDAPVWAVIVRNGCRGVSLDNVKLIGMWRYNSDGIDVCASEDTRIANTFVRSFDDCIVARGASLLGETGDLRNLTVENCVLWCDWGKNLEIWAGSQPCLIDNVAYRRCMLVNVSHTAYSTTTWYGAKPTRIQNVVVEDLEVDIDGERPLPLLSSFRTDRYPGGRQKKVAIVSVDCGKLGRNLGNQQFGEPADMSEYDIVYSNITVRDIRVLGASDVARVARIGSDVPPFRIERLCVENVPDVSFEVKGGVDLVRPLPMTSPCPPQ